MLDLVVRPLRYPFNITLDGCCEHRVTIPEEAWHRHAVENIERADALLYGRYPIPAPLNSIGLNYCSNNNSLDE